MTKRHVALTLAIIAAIFVIAYDRTRSSVRSESSDPVTTLATSENVELDRIAEDRTAETEQTAGTMTSTNPSPDTMSAAPVAGVAAEAEKTVRPSLPVSKLVPSKAKVRAEVEKDPHTTPEAVVSFSLSLGERLDRLEDEGDARKFMSELDSCVTGQVQETVTSARTLCLLNAKKVAKKYPALEAEYSNLEGRADPNVKSALDLMQ